MLCAIIFLWPLMCHLGMAVLAFTLSPPRSDGDSDALLRAALPGFSGGDYGALLRYLQSPGMDLVPALDARVGLDAFWAVSHSHRASAFCSATVTSDWRHTALTSTWPR